MTPQKDQPIVQSSPPSPILLGVSTKERKCPVRADACIGCTCRFHHYLLMISQSSYETNLTREKREHCYSPRRPYVSPRRACCGVHFRETGVVLWSERFVGYRHGIAIPYVIGRQYVHSRRNAGSTVGYSRLASKLEKYITIM